MNQDGRGVRESGFGYRGKLLLTLCKPLRTGGQPQFYPHALIPFQASYEDAKTTAIRVFSNHLVRNTSGQVHRANITLKCGARRIDGSGVWASVEPSEWSTILSTDGEEIGVFTSDNLYAPYRVGVGESSGLEVASSIRPQTQNLTHGGAPSIPMPHVPMKNINLKPPPSYDGDTVAGTLVGAPATLLELKEMAKQMFPSRLGRREASAIRIEYINSRSFDSTEVHASSYPRLILTEKEPIEMRVV